jgi:hypothetical protein
MRARELIEYLEPESDETAVVSVIAAAHGDRLRLRCASVIIGPAAIAEGWPEWRTHEGRRDGLTAPLTAGRSSGFLLEWEDGVAGRAVGDLEDVVQWLDLALRRGATPALGAIPALETELGSAPAPIEMGSQSYTAAGHLAYQLWRPMSGYLFPVASDVPAPSLADPWELGDATLYNGAMSLLAIPWNPAAEPPIASRSLLLARMQRRAWLTSHRLKDDTFVLGVKREKAQVEWEDLELEIEERYDDERVIAERLRLEDVNLPDEAHLHEGLDITLPSLGRRIERLVRLHDRDGRLLDEWRPFRMVESYSFSLSTADASGIEHRGGEQRPSPELVELLAGAQRVKAGYAQLRREGLRHRLFDQRDQARAVLRRMLERAHGDLLVADPYLGDWDLLENLSVRSVRVLLGARAADPPPEFSGRVARWRIEGGQFQVAPFHDRFFLWDGGGVNVGTSIGPGEDRLFRMVRLSSAEAAELGERLALWWSDPGFEVLR